MAASGTSPEGSDLYGLVLIGGRSTRFGQDKSQIEWQGKKAVERAYDLLSNLCELTFISGRMDQRRDYSKPYLADVFEDIGPMGGIATAIQSNPAKSWLVLAVDQLLIDSTVLHHLIKSRNAATDVSLFQDSQARFQPLCAIYEPSILPYFLHAIEKRQYALQKVIGQVNFEPISWHGDPNLFLNINTKDDLNYLRGG